MPASDFVIFSLEIYPTAAAQSRPLVFDHKLSGFTGGSIDALVRVMPLVAGRFEVMIPLTVNHSQLQSGLLLTGSVQGMCIRCGHETLIKPTG